MGYDKLLIIDSEPIEGICKIRKERLVDKPSKDLIEPRVSSEFAERGFYLSKDYDWILGVDTREQVVLVPLKKEGK